MSNLEGDKAGRLHLVFGLGAFFLFCAVFFGGFMLVENKRLSYECFSLGREISANAETITNLTDRLIRAEESMATFEIIGKASWYGTGGEHGRTTANGETFDRNALTVALVWPLPLNRWYRVTRTDTGASVRVFANDRIPGKHKRVADLSEAAMRRIGAIRPGVVPVSVGIAE